jgi:hypothetical protein
MRDTKLNEGKGSYILDDEAFQAMPSRPSGKRCFEQNARSWEIKVQRWEV